MLRNTAVKRTGKTLASFARSSPLAFGCYKSVHEKANTYVYGI